MRCGRLRFIIGGDAVRLVSDTKGDRKNDNEAERAGDPTPAGIGARGRFITGVPG